MPAKTNWMPFEEAREYVRRLGFTSTAEFKAWCKTDARPTNIPANPDNIYKNDGWQGYGDFLGTGNQTDSLTLRRMAVDGLTGQAEGGRGTPAHVYAVCVSVVGRHDRVFLSS
jgi:hypothetical protein